MNSGFQRFLAPAITVSLAAVLLLGMMLPASEPPSQMQLSEAAKLPVVEGGRVMPLDTVARNRLMVISGKQTFVDDKGNNQPAVKWLFDVMVTHDLEDLALAGHRAEGPKIASELAYHDKVFRVENDQVLNLLQLPARSGFRYSPAEMLTRFGQFAKQVQRADEKGPDSRDLFDKKVLELAQHWKIFGTLTSMQAPLVIPPLRQGEEWRSLPEAIREDFMAKRHDAATWEFVSLLSAYTKGDAQAFNKTLAKYQSIIEQHLPAEANKTGFEVFFNHFAPFWWCAALYVIVFLLACASFVAFPQDLSRAAFALAGLTLAVHTFALFSRMYMTGRPLVFVTNLYSSAIFIGWMCVILGCVLEWIFHNGLGNIVAGVTGFLTLIIAHFLATTSDKPDTMEMMQAVLDTNFWLATHVTSVTIGYSATFVAGFLGIGLILAGVFTTKLNKEAYKNLGSMIYGIVCFAMLFSFVGTVLGGIWADQSWGRFWGWDPKENGALLIVLWNALILHARWGGMVQQRGMAVLAVAGNIITTWSWFGVNMLGVGLHSYGFTSGQLMWVLTFVGSQLVVIGIGLVPLRMWPSFAAAKPVTSPALEGPAAPATAITNAPIGRKKSKHIKN